MHIPCTCGCGREVTYATKQNHLNGLGKTALRARVLSENKWLGADTGQQTRPQRKERSKKRSRSSDQDDRRKRCRAQSENSQAYADPVESLPASALNNDEIEATLPDIVSAPRQSNRIAERTRQVAEDRWGNTRLHDEGPNNCGDNDSDKDEDDQTIPDPGAENHEQGSEDDDEDNDEDDDGLFMDSSVSGFSAWELLAEGFEREASSSGSFLAYESYTH